MNVLVVDDDEETLDVVEAALSREGHRVVIATDAEEAFRRLADTPVELAILDVMLGDASGLELCARLRADGLEIPILFLSARGTVRARVDGLEAGGDDYLPKPFALRELSARVKALGRRHPVVRSRRVKVGELTLDFDARRASARGVEIPVTHREWELLQVLAAADGRAVPFDALLEQAWGDATDGHRASLEVLISRLRKKFDAACGASPLRTVRGVGYALERAE